MLDVVVRKRPVVVEEVFHDGGPAAAVPLRRAAVLSTMISPLAARSVEDIAGVMTNLEPLGLDIAGSLLRAVGGDPAAIEGYGKGAIVGQGSELEHGALWHVPGSYAMRAILGEAKAILPPTKKVGGQGTRLDVPVTHVNAASVRSHFDAMEVGTADGPRADDIVLVKTTEPRVHHRLGRLRAEDIIGKDGLR